MTLEQLVEVVLIRAYENQNEARKRLFRWEIEALVPGALARLFKRLQESGKSSKLLRTTTLVTDENGELDLPTNFVISSLESGGDGYLFFEDSSLNNYLPVSYESVFENRYLRRPMPGQYYYSIAPAATGSIIKLYLGDGQATPPTSDLNIILTGLFIPDSDEIDELDVETSELLVEVLIELVRERSMSDTIPTIAPANIPTKVVSNPSPQ